MGARVEEFAAVLGAGEATASSSFHQAMGLSPFNVVGKSAAIACDKQPNTARLAKWRVRRSTPGLGFRGLACSAKAGFGINIFTRAFMILVSSSVFSGGGKFGSLSCSIVSENYG